MVNQNKSNPLIFPKAKDRLVDIWRYTCDTWGEKQADLYLKSLSSFINQLPQRPHTWRTLCLGNSLEIYYSRFEHHFIFFKKFDRTTIGILTVLHESMDIPSKILYEIDS